MFAIEQTFLKLVDPVQDFILRRLCGELQEVIRKKSILHDCSITKKRSRTQMSCTCFIL